MIYPKATSPAANDKSDIVPFLTQDGPDFDSAHAVTVLSGKPTSLKTVAQTLASGETRLSVIIPLLNEEDSLDSLYQRLKAVLDKQAPNYEIIFVDDGSRDGSYTKLQSLWNSDPSVTVLRFRRNFGKAAALTAGFDRANGDIVLMMDADLQDQPEELPKLVAKLDEGYDLVTGWKRRRHDPPGKTLPSKVFNGTVSRYFKLNIHDFNCGFKIMRAGVARDICLYGDLHRFIPVLAAAKGYRITECAIEHAPRVHGVSKYGAKRLVTGLFDFCSNVLMVRFYNKPLHFFGTIGLLKIAIGALIGAALLAATLLGRGGAIMPLWTLSALFVVAGLIVFGLGMIAEMLTRASHRQRTDFDIDEVLEAQAAING